MRKGNFITTYSKTEFWPLDPKNEEIKKIDIAHALSMMCRANGHTVHFYSVGQHSILCAKEAKNRGYSKRVQLACLLHDASEAYISDITRPVKSMLPKYLEFEEVLQNQIYDFYGLGDMTEKEEKQVKEIDDAMLNYEMKNLLDYHGINDLEVSKEYDLSFRLMNEVEEEFLEILEELLKK